MAGGERRVRASVARDVAGGRARFRSEALIAGWLQIEHAVADEGHYAARRAHPTNLAVEGGQVEPMGGLGDGDQAGAAIGEVELFGRCAPTGDALARGWCLRSGRCWSRGRRPHGRAARKTMGGGVGLRPGKHLAHRAGGGRGSGDRHQPSEPRHRPSERRHRRSEDGHRPSEPRYRPSEPRHPPSEDEHRPSEPRYRPSEDEHRPSRGRCRVFLHQGRCAGDVGPGAGQTPSGGGAQVGVLSSSEPLRFRLLLKRGLAWAFSSSSSAPAPLARAKR